MVARKTGILVLGLITSLALYTGTVIGRRAQTADSTQKPSVELGRHLVTIAACADCHTPWVMGPSGPEPDETRHLSGHPQNLAVDSFPLLEGVWGWAGTGTNTAYVGPWGISFAANLTPCENTGLGIWTEEMFVSAIRTGRHMGQSRPIQPPMPWTAFRHMTDHELKSIYAYLRSIPPVHNRPPESMTAEQLVDLESWSELPPAS